MDIQGKTALITGANRGIGAALVRAFLKHGIGKVYAAARNTSSLPDFGDKRVVPVQLDITKPADVAAAAEKVGAIDILVNNSGVMSYNNVLTASSTELAVDMDVNYYGTIRMMQAFAPLIEKNGGGMIANLLTIAGLAPVSAIAGYSASKAAIFSATQAARAALKPKKIDVVGIFPGPIDTDLAADLTLDKASPADAVEQMIRGILDGDEDIYPDPTSKQVSALWGSNPKGLERYFATL